jgi:hypothetical protein
MKRVDLFSRTTLTRAAAELVLIVAGILIALGIDSALNERRERAMARQSLELITEDLRLLVEQSRSSRATIRTSWRRRAAWSRLSPVLSHQSSADISGGGVGLPLAPDRMVAAGIPFGPTFAGLLWSSEVDDPVPIRTRSVAMALALVAACATQNGEEISADAEELLDRIAGGPPR